MHQSSTAEARKKDTREKIELGRRLTKDEFERARLAAIGAEAFGRDGE